MDSLAAARKAVLDSTRAAQKQYNDSIRIARQQYTDSLKLVRQQRADSLAAIRKYRESKRYKDSLADARQERIDSMQAVRKAHFDSVKAVRQITLDSTLAARKAITDSIKAIQKVRTDSLAAMRKYRESKRYKDSIAFVRKERLDSIKAVRMAFNDSIAADRKARNDSLAAIRKASTDSITAVRTKYMDSVKAVRKVRTDSLAVVKAKREKAQKDRVKNREEKLQLALELKIKKKREAWSNEKMLKKRWSLPRQVVQNTFTRYNYYFNTDKKMDEALDNMQRLKKENYDSLLALFPFDPDIDSAALSADMDSIIQKASVGIQIHDPRTKWADDLYLLLGQAYYYKGDYENAATAFKYIVSLNEKNKNKSKIKNTSSRRPATNGKTEAVSVMEADDKNMLDFLKHRSVLNESLLWLARTYTEWHQEGNAESVLDLLDTDPNMPESLKGRMALERAYVYLSQRDYRGASKQLDIVAADGNMPDWIRQRASYLNGQLQYNAGNYTAAASSFDRVIDLRPKIDMDFYARKNKAYSQMMAGTGQEDAIASLRNVLNDGKYLPYHEQVYYMMGALSANTGDNKQAIEYLEKGIKAPKATRGQKAKSYAVLGNVYYNMQQYSLAKTAYDSASVMASAAAGDSVVAFAIRRAAVLGSVTNPADVIRRQDSLLALAAMSEREQRNEVRRYIRYLQDKRSDSIFTAENAGLNNVLQNAANATVNNTPGAPSYANWYFSNPMQMQQGFNEFKRKWGGRPLVDKWRRQSAISITANNSNNNPDAPSDANVDMQYDENGIPTEESLLAYIPSTQERKEQALASIRRAYVDLADAYIKKLEDYPQATHTLDTLDKRFPAHEFKAEVLYLRYLSALKQNKIAEAQGYAAQLQQQYGSSQWAQLVKPTEDGGGLANVNNGNVANYYDETYSLLLQRQYTQVLMRSQDGQKRFNDPVYLKRFRIMEAIALVGTNDFVKADTLVSDFISKNPSDPLRPWADMVMEYIKKYKTANPNPSGNAGANAAAALTAPGGAPAAAPARSAASDMAKAAADTTAAGRMLSGAANPADIGVPVVPAAANPPKTYTYNAKEPHYVLFAFPQMEQRAMGVRAAMTDFNTFKFGSLSLESKAEMLNSKQGIVVTRSFENESKARIYINALKATPPIFREYKTGEYQLLMISASNYLKLATDKDMNAYMNFYKANYK